MKNLVEFRGKASPQPALDQIGDEALATELAISYVANARLGIELTQEFASVDMDMWSRLD